MAKNCIDHLGTCDLLALPEQSRLVTPGRRRRSPPTTHPATWWPFTDRTSGSGLRRAMSGGWSRSITEAARRCWKAGMGRRLPGIPTASPGGSAARKSTVWRRSMLLSDGVDAPFRRHRNVPCWRCRQRQERKGASMERVSMIGIDLAKNSFQAHGARADGSVAFRRMLFGVQF